MKPSTQRVPVVLPYAAVRFLAGSPVILSARDELAICELWTALLALLRAHAKAHRRKK